MMPKWIPPKDHAHILDDGQVRNLIEGITIAVEALEKIKAYGRPLEAPRASYAVCEINQGADEALRRIEELGT